MPVPDAARAMSEPAEASALTSALYSLHGSLVQLCDEAGAPRPRLGVPVPSGAPVPVPTSAPTAWPPELAPAGAADGAADDDARPAFRYPGSPPVLATMATMTTRAESERDAATDAAADALARGEPVNLAATLSTLSADASSAPFVAPWPRLSLERGRSAAPTTSASSSRRS